MANTKSEINHDGHETERFVDLARKLVAVPKTEVDERIKKERQKKQKKKEAERS